MKRKLGVMILPILMMIPLSTHAQLEWARVTIDCPCTLESDDGETARVTFGLTNHESLPTDNLYATIAVTGYFEDEEFADEKSAFLGTAAMNRSVSAKGRILSDTYEVEFGQLPAGKVFFELLVHEGPVVTEGSLLDFVWFEGETQLPVTSINKGHMDFLVDSDEDGVADVNEHMEGTDPLDPLDFPPPPTIDVVVAYESSLVDYLEISDLNAYFSHLFAVTNFFFQRSGATVQFRIVALLDEEQIPEVLDDSNLLLPVTTRDEIVEDYGADLVVVFHPGTLFLCGIAEDIGGWRGRGFIHRHDRAILTHIWLDRNRCPLNVTAHEIGHLLGLGHSFVQGAIGTFYWSRGHGVQDEFGTVMSYNRSDYNGIDIDKFSNPHEDCNSHPCGISHELPNHEKSADSVLSVNITKYQVASTSTPSSTLDIDGDGYAAIEDLYPLNPNEWEDSDGDGIGDNADLFPNDASEWVDTDGDGVGDNKDPDIDNDGIPNHEDADPFDAEVSYLRLLSIESDYLNDHFGRAVVRTNDLNGDGVGDLAVSAPTVPDRDTDTVGKIYLFSLSDLVVQPITESGDERFKRSLSDLVAMKDNWVIEGTRDDVDLGEHLLYLPSDSESDTPSMLLVSTRDTVYLIQLDTSELRLFDRLDGVADRTLSLSHCGESSACWYVGDNHGFVVHDIATMHDRDLDGIADFAVIGERSGSYDTSLYLITTGAITSFEDEDHQELNVFDVLVATHEDCYRIYTHHHGDLSVSNIGDIRGYIGHELGIGIGDPNRSGTGMAYVLNTELALLFDLIDGSQDGEVKLEDFIGGEHGSFQLTHTDDNVLALNMDQIADLDGDDRPETIIWGESPPHPVVSIQGLLNMDELDGELDGLITSEFESITVDGIWYLDSFLPETGHSQTVTQTMTTSHDNTLLGESGGDVVSAHFDNLDELDNPNTDHRNRRVNLISRLTLPQVYYLKNLRDLRPSKPVSGMTALDDLDADGITDYMYTTTTQDAEYSYQSVLQVIFSSSLVALDRADGVEDGVVALHNNLDDSDDDGIINMYDLDDDNDGAPDVSDAYPLDATAIYDVDGDHVADVIDLFPDNSFTSSDLDFDGIADRYDSDIDGDGIRNDDDDYPFDTDNDGTPNIFDDDDDGDGIADADDDFPVDATKQYDSDGDGYADNVDEFPNDPTDWVDFDGDGIGNNSDSDDDNDGVSDRNDPFPFNPSEWADSDGDGVGNNADQFPYDYFEWADADGDGIGDNLKGASISSYRIVSDWGPLNYFPVSPSSHTLFELTEDSRPRIVLQNASPHDDRGPTHIVSIRDLAILDVQDRFVDHTVNVSRVARSNNGWELRGSYTPSGSAHQSRGAILDVNADGVTDLLMSNYAEDSGNGMITIVNGATMEAADAFDGKVDGKINYVQCVRDNLCTNIRSSHQSYFGYSFTTLKGLYDSSSWGAIGVSNFFGSVWQDTDQGSPPIAVLISTAAIADQTSGSVDADFDLERVLKHKDVLQIYSEFPEFDATAFGTLLAQLADYDGDGAEDLLLYFPSNSSVYVLASQDILAADAKDNNIDGRVSVASIVSGENSYRISNFRPITPNARTSIPSLETDDSQFISLQSNIDRSTVLLNVSDLATFDQADGNTDGIITDVNVTGTNSWQIDGLTETVLCTNSTDSESTYAIGIGGSRFTPRFFLFNLGTLEKISETTANERIVNLPDAAASGDYDIWTIRFGFQTNVLRREIDVACVGDLDADEMEDVVWSYRRTSYGTIDFTSGIPRIDPKLRSSTIVMMSSDLDTLDGLDRRIDKNLALSRLWRSDNP